MFFQILEERSLKDRLALLPQLITLEQSSYPASEAASEASLDLRVRKCASWFVVLFKAEEDDTVLGFACGTLGFSDMIVSSEAMTKHEPEGTHLYLHSVVLQEKWRGRGLALQLCKEFLSAARKSSQVVSVSLVTKARGIGLYNRAGFSFMGDSLLRHGSERWYKMERLLHTRRVVCVDAFANNLFSGNSAAVVLLSDKQFVEHSVVNVVNKKMKVDDKESEYLGLVAREMNLAETAFIHFEELNGTGFGTTLDPLNRIAASIVCGKIHGLVFNETLSIIKKSFVVRSDVHFSVGNVKSEKGQNVGSLSILSFGQAIGLSRTEIPRLWCEHYKSVLDSDPEDTSHPNIRSYLAGGEIKFFDENNHELLTPIESFDVLGLSLLVTKDSPLLKDSPEIIAVAQKVAKEHIHVKGDHEEILPLFQKLFELDCNEQEFRQIKSLSPALLEIVLRANIIDLPESILMESLQGEKLDRFCLKNNIQTTKLKASSSKNDMQSLVTTSNTLTCCLRWFTPGRVEIDLCGHATLAAAHALFFEIGPIAHRADFTEIHFKTRSGILIARRNGQDIVLDFPLQTITKGENTSEPILSFFPELESQDVLFVGVTSTNDLIVEITPDAFHTRLSEINFLAFKSLSRRGVAVTSAGGDKEQDFSSRFFAPSVGINEDPVTGSMHCYLAPYWSSKLGKQALEGYQASERGGIVRCEVKGDRVLLAGSSCVSWRGEVMQVE